MANHTYIIRQQDINAAITFIDRQLNKNPEWLDETESLRMIAEQEYLQARIEQANFNAWCQKWLNENQWAEIKQAICLARGRQEIKSRYIEPDKMISVTHQAWQILSAIALQDQVTLSEVIINRLGGNNAVVSQPPKSRYNLTS